MSRELAFDSSLRAGKRRLSISTRFEPESRKAVTSVLDGEELVDHRENLIDESVAPEQLEAEVRQLHDLTVSDLDLLFCVNDKVLAGENAGSLTKLGTLFLEKGFYDEAIDTFSTVLQRDENFENIHYSLGRAWYRKGDLDQALENLRRRPRSGPDIPMSIISWPRCCARAAIIARPPRAVRRPSRSMPIMSAPISCSA